MKRKADRSLESFTIFPYVAWTITILFAVFVYNLATNLQTTATKLNAQVEILEATAATPVDQIEDFDL